MKYCILKIENITDDLRLADEVAEVPVGEFKVAAISWLPHPDHIIGSSKDISVHVTDLNSSDGHGIVTLDPSTTVIVNEPGTVAIGGELGDELRDGTTGFFTDRSEWNWVGNLIELVEGGIGMDHGQGSSQITLIDGINKLFVKSANNFQGLGIGAVGGEATGTRTGAGTAAGTGATIAGRHRVGRFGGATAVRRRRGGG